MVRFNSFVLILASNSTTFLNITCIDQVYYTSLGVNYCLLKNCNVNNKSEYWLMIYCFGRVLLSTGYILMLHKISRGSWKILDEYKKYMDGC